MIDESMLSLSEYHSTMSTSCEDAGWEMSECKKVGFSKYLAHARGRIH